MQYQNLINYVENVHNQLLAKEKDHRRLALIEQITKNQQKVGLLFAGQGFDFMSEIADLYTYSETAREWINQASNQLKKWTQSEEILSKGMFSMGLRPMLWIREERQIPQTYLQQVSISHPLIFIAQVARFLAVPENGLSSLSTTQSVSFVAGYSQGILPATLISELWGR